MDGPLFIDCGEDFWGILLTFESFLGGEETVGFNRLAALRVGIGEMVVPELFSTTSLLPSLTAKSYFPQAERESEQMSIRQNTRQESVRILGLPLLKIHVEIHGPGGPG